MQGEGTQHNAETPEEVVIHGTSLTSFRGSDGSTIFEVLAKVVKHETMIIFMNVICKMMDNICDAMCEENNTIILS